MCNITNVHLVQDYTFSGISASVSMVSDKAAYKSRLFKYILGFKHGFELDKFVNETSELFSKTYRGFILGIYFLILLLRNLLIC